MSVKKLILGTAGLGGLEYGRSRERVNEREAKQIIHAAYDAGIKTFDTAPAYGNAEEWLGEALVDRPSVIYTKTTGDRLETANSLLQLKGHLVKILFHNWTPGPVPMWVDGISTYSDVAEFAVHLPVYTIQYDWNLLRQKMIYPSMQGIPLHRIARSILLQGVLAGNILPDERLEPFVEAADTYAAAFGMNLPELALRAALEEERFEYVIVGPTTISELNECLRIAKTKPAQPDFFKRISMLDAGNVDLTDPRKWVA